MIGGNYVALTSDIFDQPLTSDNSLNFDLSFPSDLSSTAASANFKGAGLTYNSAFDDNFTVNVNSGHFFDDRVNNGFNTTLWTVGADDGREKGITNVGGVGVTVLVKDISLSVTLGLLCLVTVINNALVLHAVRIETKLQTVSNMFIVSLAIADLIVGIVVMPISAAYVVLNSDEVRVDGDGSGGGGGWIFGPVVCQLWIGLDYIASTASILNLVVLSLDRYWSITEPLKYIRRRTKRRGLLLIFLAWFLSSLWLVPILGWHHFFNGGVRTVAPDTCDTEYATNTTLKIVTAILNYYLPLAVMYSLYTRIYIEIRRRRLALASTGGALSVTTVTPAPLSDTASAKRRRARFAVKPSSRVEDDDALPFATSPDNGHDMTTSSSCVADDAVFIADDRNQSMMMSTSTAPIHLSSSNSHGSGENETSHGCLSSSRCRGAIGATRRRLASEDDAREIASSRRNNWSVRRAGMSYGRDEFAIDLKTRRIYTKSEGRTRIVQPSTSFQHRLLSTSNNNSLGIRTLVTCQGSSSQSQQSYNNALGNQSSQLNHVTNSATEEELEGRSSLKGSEGRWRWRQWWSHSESARSVCDESAQKSPGVSPASPAQQNASRSGPVRFFARSPSSARWRAKRYGSEDENTPSSFRPSAFSQSTDEALLETSSPRTPPSSSSSSAPSCSLRREVKAARQLGVIMIVFTICFCPYFVCFVVVAFCETCVTSELMIAVTWVGYLNSALNPLLYPLCNAEFRTTFLKMLRLGGSSQQACSRQRSVY